MRLAFKRPNESDPFRLVCVPPHTDRQQTTTENRDTETRRQHNRTGTNNKKQKHTRKRSVGVVVAFVRDHLFPLAMLLGEEGIWAAIAERVRDVERDEIARIIGSKRIQDNQVPSSARTPRFAHVVYLAICSLQDLWQEVQAYTDILSEMHMLASDNLEERFALRKDHPADSKSQAKAAATVASPASSSLYSSSGASAVPPLSLQGKHKKPTAAGSVADGKHDVSGKGSSSKSSSGSGTVQRNELKSVPNKQMDSPGASSARSSSSSSGGGGGGGSSSSSSSSEYGSMCSDAAEFVASIQQCLTIDRIAAVVDDIKAAFDTERAELMFKIKQLEATMEGDCEVVSTNRSGGRSSKPSPRTERDAFPAGNQPYHPRGGGGGGGGGGRVISNGFWDEEDDDRAVDKGRGRVAQCTMCGGDVGEYFSQDIAAAPGTGSARLPIAAGTEICLDCRARSRREKKLLSRLPKALLAPTVAAASSQERAADDDAGLANRVGPSKFRNRLQAARDEHHFIDNSIFLS